jgi:hypothetical protein
MLTPSDNQAPGTLGPIQIIPPGLTGLLQLKQTGKLPNSLSQLVNPVVELRDWYLTARRVDEIALQLNASTFLATTGGQGFQAMTTPLMVVPQTQIWWVEEYTIDAVIATAADTIRMCCTLLIQNNTGVVSHQQLGPDVADTVTARARVVSCRADRGFWAFPGDVFGATVFDVLSAGGINLRPRLRATPCPI